MLPSTSPREAFLVCPPSPPWNLPSFTMESTLSSPYPCSDLNLSRQGAALAHLDSLPSHDLVLWTDGSVPFPFGKGGSSLCWLFAGHGSTNKSAISLLFFSYLTLILSSPLCPVLHLSFYLNLCSRSGRNCPLSPPVLSSYNGSPDTRFYRRTTRLMSWPDGERYSCPLQSLVVSLLFSLEYTLLFSRIGGVLSHLNSLTHMFP